jgi:carbamoyl-phosphate synthase large subunit
VHSGDATLVLPAQKLYIETLRLVKKIASQIAASLNITGPFNIQFLSRDNEIKVQLMPSSNAADE